MPFFRLMFNIIIIMIIVRGLTMLFTKIAQMISSKKAKKRYEKMEEEKKNAPAEQKQEAPTEVVAEQESNIEVKHFGKSKRNKDVQNDVSDITFDSPEDKAKSTQQTQQTNPNQPIVEE